MLFVLGIILLPFIPNLLSGDFSGIEIPNLFIPLGVLTSFILILILIGYKIEGDELKLTVGPFVTASLRIDQITLVKRTYNPLSGPAGSLKRLSIESQNDDWWLISPANENEFVRLLKEKNPNIQVTIDDKTGWWRFWDWDV